LAHTELQEHGLGRVTVTPGENDNTLILGSEKGDVVVWDLAKNSKTSLNKHRGPVGALLWHNSTKTLISGGADGVANVYTLPSYKLRISKKLHEDGTIKSFAIAEDARRLVTGCGDMTVNSPLKKGA
jgi:WD40 repeat protein